MMWLKAFALLVAAIMLPGTALAQAEYRGDPYGSRGDAGAELRCDSGRYVVGMAGAFGTNIDRIQLICAKLGPDGRALPSDNSTVTVGGFGGGPQRTDCAGNTYVIHLIVWLTKTKNQVQLLEGSCSRPADGSNVYLSFGLSGNGELPSRTFACPTEMAMTGLAVRYGKHVNAAGVICGTIVLQPAPAPPITTAPVVPRPLKPRPPFQSPSFVGSYGLTSRSGIKATLVVSQGDGNDVFGTISSTDLRYNGKFTGTVEVGGRKFTLTYRDAATGVTGKGTFKYIDREATAIIGGFTSDGPPPVTEIWGGPRR